MLKWTVGDCLARKVVRTPSWMSKLTENWGKTKIDFKVDVARPSSLSFLICFQAGAQDQCTTELSLKKYACPTGQ